eukprot:TRINITY_DN13438_c0_g1_i2.p1 TRINITY_DN13438_c0_g1~~TRINITY_DN13438_c0_g1_i2.p1  ORF type:complete len:659 (-),score=117.51 TRINITY_DN13438_c0_g1_i2:103-2079(-)
MGGCKSKSDPGRPGEADTIDVVDAGTSAVNGQYNIKKGPETGWRHGTHWYEHVDPGTYRIYFFSSTDSAFADMPDGWYVTSMQDEFAVYRAKGSAVSAPSTGWQVPPKGAFSKPGSEPAPTIIQGSKSKKVASSKQASTPKQDASPKAAGSELDVKRLTVEQLAKETEALAITLQQQWKTYAKTGGQVPQPASMSESICKDLSKMDMAALTKEEQRLNELLDKLNKEDRETIAVLHSSSSFKGVHRKNSKGESRTESSAQTWAKLSAQELAEIKDPSKLLGQDDDYGLVWDRCWQNKPPGPPDEHHRGKTREGTKKKVAQELGLPYFGKAPSPSVRPPPGSAETVLFVDSRASGEPNAAAGGENILGRYDVLCLRVCADYDRDWQFIKASRKDFWVAHAAAINIGESVSAPDFGDFCIAPNPGDASGKLNEELYFSSMGSIFENIAYACTNLKIQSLILFPFGMGAFLRHLGQLDSKYFDDEEQQRLRRRVARECVAALAKGTSEACHIHLCLMFGHQESERNADAFIRALVAKEAASLGKRVTIWPEGDSFHLANMIASKDSKNVMLLNGANRRLLGNHWFAGRAKIAIDENLHRRSWRMSAMAYLLNDFDASREFEGRSGDELEQRVKKLGGRVEMLWCSTSNTSTKNTRGKANAI